MEGREVYCDMSGGRGGGGGGGGGGGRATPEGRCPRSENFQNLRKDVFSIRERRRKQPTFRTFMVDIASYFRCIFFVNQKRSPKLLYKARSSEKLPHI